MNELEKILNSKTPLKRSINQNTTQQADTPSKLPSISKSKKTPKTVKKESKKEKKSKIFFEDFVFEEPPLDDTDLGENHFKTSQTTTTFKRDDEFWEYYQQNT